VPRSHCGSLRFTVLRVQPSRHSKPIMTSLAEELGRLPADARRSVTLDRGTEFAAYPALKASLGMEAYFCAPQAPWQKDTVESTNGRLRTSCRWARTSPVGAPPICAHSQRR
jgi:IS30 family transposase